MAQTATLYNAHVDLADMNRGVYESLDLRVARHPSESAEYMVVRILAYCLEYEDGIAFTEGLSSGDEPAVVVRDLTGRITAWIEVGLPEPSRLHRASKSAERVAVYTHRDVRQYLGQFVGERIHRADAITVHALDHAAVEDLASRLERRMSFALSIDGDELTVSLDEGSVLVSMTAHRLVESRR